MTLQEFWWLFDGKVAAQRKTAPSKAAGGFSPAEWATARRKHKEKMND
jgi:hypothetical protein